jgi:hypothetical protein
MARFRHFCRAILQRAATLSSEENFRNDRYIKVYTVTLPRLLDRLDEISSFRDCCVTFSSAQRTYLELDARLDWLVIFQLVNPGPPPRDLLPALLVHSPTILMTLTHSTMLISHSGL